MRDSFRIVWRNGTRKSLQIVLLVLCGMAPVTVRAIDKVKVTMAASSCYYAPYFVAIQKGYYASEGIEVEIIQAGGGTATPALISGQVHFSTSSASALSAILKGAPITVVMTLLDRPMYQLWSTKPDIKSLDDLEGKAVGINSRGDTMEIALRLVLEAHGINPNSIIYTPLGYGPARRATVASGSLPAAVISLGDVQGLQETGALTKGHMLSDIFNEVSMAYGGIATNNELLEDNPELVKRFLKATLMGMAYTRQFEKETLDIVALYDKGATRTALSVAYDGVVESLTEYGAVSRVVQEQETEIRAELIGVPKQKIRPLEEMFDYDVVTAAYEELQPSGWKPER
jgi:NitT/TauT family transport system substrate-binding protein